MTTANKVETPLRSHSHQTQTLRGNVLIVEDDDLTGAWLVKELQHRGLETTLVKTRAQAQKAAETTAKPFHAVVCDIYLEDGKSGLDVIAEWEKYGLPVIVITSRADLSIAKESLNRGAAHLLEKPFQVQELVQILQKCWEEPRGLTGLLEHFLEVNHFTPKEKDIARFVLKGLSNREIAEVMGNTEKTIKFHLTVIFQKCGVKSRTEFFNAIFPT